MTKDREPTPTASDPPNSKGRGDRARDDLFVALFARNERAVRAYVRSLLPSSRDVDDVMQNVDLACWRTFDTFGAEENSGVGLHDVHGNVWEWCQDRYARYEVAEDGPLINPTGPEKGRFRVWRGGPFADDRMNTRVAARSSNNRPHDHPEYLAGFRVVREMEDG